jgi:hypothetical protein
MEGGDVSNKTQQRSAEIINAAYAHILENGPSTEKSIAEITGCAMITVGSHRIMVWNHHMRMHDKPHVFRVKPGIAGKSAVWSLKERASA